MRYYWEAIFSVEYFPYWEFSMLMVLGLNLSALWRLHILEDNLNGLTEEMWGTIKKTIKKDKVK